jgi:hypothetical protein
MLSRRDLLLPFSELVGLNGLPSSNGDLLEPFSREDLGLLNEPPLIGLFAAMASTSAYTPAGVVVGVGKDAG